MPSNNQKLLGFHIDRGHGTVRVPRYSEAPEILVGRTYKATGRIRMCSVGCHASPTIMAAARYRYLEPGRTISLVEVWGDTRKSDTKFVGRFRKVLAIRKINGEVPTIEKSIHTGIGEKVEVEVVDPKWVEKIEKDLVAKYRANKRRIDAMNEVVNLPR